MSQEADAQARARAVVDTLWKNRPELCPHPPRFRYSLNCRECVVEALLAFAEGERAEERARADAEEHRARCLQVELDTDLLGALKELLPEGWDDGTMDHMPGVRRARLAIAEADTARGSRSPEPETEAEKPQDTFNATYDPSVLIEEPAQPEPEKLPDGVIPLDDTFSARKAEMIESVRRSERLTGKDRATRIGSTIQAGAARCPEQARVSPKEEKCLRHGIYCQGGSGQVMNPVAACRAWDPPKIAADPERRGE